MHFINRDRVVIKNMLYLHCYHLIKDIYLALAGYSFTISLKPRKVLIICKRLTFALKTFFIGWKTKLDTFSLQCELQFVKRYNYSAYFSKITSPVIAWKFKLVFAPTEIVNPPLYTTCLQIYPPPPLQPSPIA